MANEPKRCRKCGTETGGLFHTCNRTQYENGRNDGVNEAIAEVELVLRDPPRGFRNLDGQYRRMVEIAIREKTGVTP